MKRHRSLSTLQLQVRCVTIEELNLLPPFLPFLFLLLSFLFPFLFSFFLFFFSANNMKNLPKYTVFFRSLFPRVTRHAAREPVSREP